LRIVLPRGAVENRLFADNLPGRFFIVTAQGFEQNIAVGLFLHIVNFWAGPEPSTTDPEWHIATPMWHRRLRPGAVPKFRRKSCTFDSRWPGTRLSGVSIH
jgi:hypothetical protein